MEQTIRRALLLVALAAIGVLFGCASGSALVTGQQRPALADHTTVTIMTTMPEDAEEIAIVKASSGAGWTEQDSLNYAVEELKRQAAKVGANAVVILDRDSSSHTYTVPVYGGDPIATTSESEVVRDIAIWIK